MEFVWFDKKTIFAQENLVTIHTNCVDFTQTYEIDWSMQDHTISRYDVLIGDEI
jgi:hypothetical protein